MSILTLRPRKMTMLLGLCICIYSQMCINGALQNWHMNNRRYSVCFLLHTCDWSDVYDSVTESVTALIY